MQFLDRKSDAACDSLLDGRATGRRTRRLTQYTSHSRPEATMQPRDAGQPAPAQPDASQLWLDNAAGCSRFLRRLLDNPPACFDRTRLTERWGLEQIRSLLESGASANEAELANVLRE